MESIEVGEYVRTKEGNIFKVIGGDSDNYDIDCSYYKLEFLEDEWFEGNRYNDNGYFFNEHNIVKHSKNIIDLIEVGDIVQVKGLRGVRQVIKDDFFDDEVFNNDVRAIIANHYSKQITNFQIKSILTKELFEVMEYKL